MGRGESLGVPFGQYNIDGIIGRGANATVFRASHRDGSDPVALKVLRSIGQEGEILSETGLRESFIHASLQHPHILGYRSYGVYYGNGKPEPYHVLELAPHGSVADEITKSGEISMPKVVNYTMQTARAVEEVHREGFLHLDIKLGNVLLVGHHVKLADFGSSQCNTVATQNFIECAPQYIAPERANQGRISEQTDVYAAGGVMPYRLATGRFPIHADSVDGYMDACQTDEPPTFEQVLGRDMTMWHEALEGPVMRALSKRPEDRHEGMGHYVEDITTNMAQVINKHKAVVIDLR